MSPASSDRLPTNSRWFREVLGQYPTGVCIITASDTAASAAAMAVGSFTSASLDPPLVAFFPDRSSTSWPKIKAAGRFCVNILSAEQEAICRRFAAKGGNKFEGLACKSSPAGSPIIESCLAWIDCELYSVQDAGDHLVVLGRVLDLQIEAGGLPLVFFQGGYGRFSPRSLVVDTLGVVTDQLRWVDAARPDMERLADSLPARCIATVRVKDELVIAASAGRSTHGTTPTLVGQRLPFMPPTGSVLAAWSGKADVAAWLLAASNGNQRKSFEESLQAVRSRGYSIGLVNDAQRAFVSTLERLAAERGAAHPADLREQIQNLRYDPASMSPEVEQDVRLISAPIFGPESEPLLALTIYDFPKPQPGLGIRHYVYSVLETTARVTERLGGVPPSL